MIMPDILPVEELVSPEEFTDRVEILRELETWHRNIKHRISSSLALISPRRMGKTAVLDKLVNTVFFKDYGVAPFYFKMKREETTLHRFLLEYCTTFFRQYIAYLLQDPIMYGSRKIDLHKLLDLKTDNEKVRYVQEEHIKPFVERYQREGWQDARNHWDAMITAPEFIGAMLGIHVAVIIDEFQDMKFYIYDMENLENIKPGISFNTDLTATYDRQSQSRRAPMLVSGSAVTMTFHTVMGGPLGGRFGFKYLKPMTIEDGATLLKKMLGAHGMSVTDELAIYLRSQVSGHPYYIYCCVESDCPDRSFTTRDDIDRIIAFEATRGKIFGFWESHFAENRQHINQDNDQELGKKIIYYFTRYNNAPVDINEIAGKLQVSRYAVEEKIEKLYQADLVYRSDFKYYTFNDIMLMRYIQHRYQNELQDVEKVDLHEQGLFNYVKGKFLEMVVQNLMFRFAGEELDGALFGRPGEKVTVPLFQTRGDMVVKLPDSHEYQVDAYRGYHANGVWMAWLAESKNRKNEPMKLAEVERTLQAAVAVQEVRKHEACQVWLVSTGGFTKEALAVAQEKRCLFTGQEEINKLVHLYGIGVKVVDLRNE